ncbi:MAG: anti-sigma factor [Cyclobacteriaceae bacterium]
MQNNSPKTDQSGCKEFEKFLKILYLMLDNEANDSEEQYVVDHIDRCMSCLEQFEVEKQLRLLLKTKLAKKKVPVDLASEIKRKIHNLPTA